MIPRDVFSSQSKFDADFNYLYPWGTDHNGASRMDKAHVSIEYSSNTLTLAADRVSGQPPATHGGKQIPINYLAGTVHAKEHFSVAPTGGYDFEAEFLAPVTRGTWPAFWLTAVDGWPPEIDLAEWKGSGKISFNTFNTSSQVSAKDVNYPSPGNWHKILCELRDLNRADVGIKFYMDGQLVTSQVGKGFVGKRMWFVINLQMEGSSGTPGPNGSRQS
ncbi:glycoside hydrolase family 16 protein [Patellaria atrata CBS 101060]|uniref:Glycoside hydrolase family 16 protein n=1 Tax=Patellaria atrata CBS 101060 TaxID=1346257 RepID=A0A9P4SIB1_9PEZI|nr:glycoside hydrolase family 16 protein [Patellaria atrata CBS 101060]